MTQLSPPPYGLTKRFLKIREHDGTLFLATPMGRHWLVALLCLPLPLAFFGLQFLSPAAPSWSDYIEHRGLGMLADWLLPALFSAPLPMSLGFAAFALIGFILLGHRITGTVNARGILLRHSLYWLPYWSIRIRRADIIDYTITENGAMLDGTPLMSVMVNCSAAPEVRGCGIRLTPVPASHGRWQEWLTFSLPGAGAAEYVLARVQAACPAGSNAELTISA